MGTPGVDYQTPNPELVNTKVCYGLTPTGLTTVVAAYKEVRFSCNTCTAPQAAWPDVNLVPHAHMPHANAFAVFPWPCIETAACQGRSQGPLCNACSKVFVV